MVSVLDSGASDPGLSPGRGHKYLYILGKTIYSRASGLKWGINPRPLDFSCRVIVTVTLSHITTLHEQS